MASCQLFSQTPQLMHFEPSSSSKVQLTSSGDKAAIAGRCQELRKQIGKPFWIDTVGRSSLVEIRIQLEDTVLRVFARRSRRSVRTMPT